MTREEWTATLINVASDLQAIAEQMDDPKNFGPTVDDLVKDAKLAVEYITHDQPHL